MDYNAIILEIPSAGGTPSVVARRLLNSAPRRVAVCVDKSRKYGRGVLRGIADYVETHARWSLVLDPRASGTYGADWLRDWEGDGILAFIDDPGLASAVRCTGIPTVELFGHRLDLGLPHVGNDEEAFGRLAAEHLLERRFGLFAFAGIQGALWAERRGRGFAQALEASGAEADVFLCPPDDGSSLRSWEANLRKLEGWLGSFASPTGLLAASDRLALRVLDACRRARRRVPEEIAVIGVDNDEETCWLADPPLTSVMDDARQVGRLAAELLDDFMTGKEHPGRQQVLVPPSGIATRRSTDVTAVADPLVARACQLIRDRACEGLTVEALTTELGLSRTLFYGRFKRSLGRLPHQEILRTRLERVQALLRQTTLSVAEIARRCGFTNPEYLNVAFKRTYGVTPGRFRTPR
jgi:LacI family transcriptional regulator